MPSSTKTRPTPADEAAQEFAEVPDASLEAAAKRIFSEDLEPAQTTSVIGEASPFQPTNITPMTAPWEPKKLSLHLKLADVMRMVERIPKNGKAPAAMGGFEFVQVGDAAKAVREQLAYHGVTMMPTNIELIASSEHDSKSGGVMTTETYRVQWTFVDGESGERYVIYSVGTGADRGDKASPKAQTNAMKYALLMAFLMPTGDDPEQEDSSDRQSTRRSRGSSARVERSENGGDKIVIEDSAATGVRQGGRQDQSTQAQIAEIGRYARRLKLGPLALAAILDQVLPAKPVPDFEPESDNKGKTEQILRHLKTLDHEEAAAVIQVLMKSTPPKEDTDGSDPEQPE